MSRDEMIEIAAELDHDRDASWAVWCGDMEDDPRNPGEERKKLVFLPKSKCKLGEAKGTWMVPEWMAQEKGLI